MELNYKDKLHSKLNDHFILNTFFAFLSGFLLHPKNIPLAAMAKQICNLNVGVCVYGAL